MNSGDLSAVEREVVAALRAGDPGAADRLAALDDAGRQRVISHFGQAAGSEAAASEAAASDPSLAGWWEFGDGGWPLTWGFVSPDSVSAGICRGDT